MKPTPQSTAGATPPSPGCETCGRPDALKMDERWLCPDCIAIAGSCCPEFGAWDAWSARGEPEVASS